MKPAIIFTDGASKGNPGPGGWGAIVATEDIVHEFGGAEGHTTNNRMELLAVIEGLRRSLAMKPEAVAIYSDSAYTINGATKWIYGWKRNGWETREKKDVLNRELWEQLSVLLQSGTQISWNKVGGHVMVPGNERADVIATSFAKQETIQLYDGLRANYLIDLAKIEHNAEASEKRSAARKHSNAKAYSYVSKVDGTIMTHKSWDECKKRVDGKKALYKKSLSAEDEAAIIKNFERR